MKKNVIVCDICGDERKPYDLMYHIKKPRIYSTEWKWSIDGIDKTKIDICPSCWKNLIVCVKEASYKEED